MLAPWHPITLDNITSVSNNYTREPYSDRRFSLQSTHQISPLLVFLDILPIILSHFYIYSLNRGPADLPQCLFNKPTKKTQKSHCQSSHICLITPGEILGEHVITNWMKNPWVEVTSEVTWCHQHFNSPLCGFHSHLHLQDPQDTGHLHNKLRDSSFSLSRQRSEQNVLEGIGAQGQRAWL